MASPFWQYFHDRLHWPGIFRPGPLSALVKGLALHMDTVREDVLWLRRQWTPVTSEDDMIVGYGESRGIPRMRLDTGELYRQRAITAYIWHMLGGKVRGVERIYAENGFLARIVSASAPELWAHFRVLIDVNATEFGPDASELAWFLANEYKPARSKIEYFTTDITIPLGLHVGVALRTLTQSRSRLYFAPQKVPQLVRRPGLACGGRTSSRLSFQTPQSQPPFLYRRTAVGMTAITTSRVLTARAI